MEDMMGVGLLSTHTLMLSSATIFCLFRGSLSDCLNISFPAVACQNNYHEKDFSFSFVLKALSDQNAESEIYAVFNNRELHQLSVYDW